MSKRDELSKQILTPEEKERWAGMFHRTWSAIADDAAQIEGRLTRSIIVELVCDANRVQHFAGMTDEEYEFLGAIYNTKRFQSWARGVCNY